MSGKEDAAGNTVCIPKAADAIGGPRRAKPAGGEEERTQRLRATKGSPKQSVFSDDDAKKTVANGSF